MSDGLPLPDWIKPSHIETMKSIVMKKENLEIFFGNPTMQKLLIGKSNILLQLIRILLMILDR